MNPTLSQFYGTESETGGKKFYVLDTSVLLSDPQALFKFEEHVVLLPLVVITELEKKRNDPELGFFARTALRNIEDVQAGEQAKDLKTLGEGGGKFGVITEVNLEILPEGIDTRSNDARILATALEGTRNTSGVVLVSRDLPMRILAASLGVAAENYRAEGAAHRDYSGIATIEVDYEVIEELLEHGGVELDEFDDLEVNSGVIVRSGTASALSVHVGKGQLVNITDLDEVFEVKARSAEQKVALSHLLRGEIGIVSIGGRAGTGKSAMALLAGIQGVLEEPKKFKKVVIFRPLYAVGGQDLGFLPGDHTEKMNPWAQAVYDTLEPLVSSNVLDELVSRNAIEVLPLTHIRGRSLHDAYVIVDEAQSLERNVLLTVLSRMGQNSKIVLTHDVAQRDNLHVGRWDGVLSVVESLKGERLFAHITLRKSERSAIAELVTRLLDS